MNAATEKARPIVGLCRGIWSWDGRVFTAQGVEVPSDIMATDEARYEAKLDIAPDDQVLEMVVTLPVEALPAGYILAPIPGAPKEAESEPKPPGDPKPDEPQAEGQAEEQADEASSPTKAAKKK
jgi:hypothetical protein